MAKKKRLVANDLPVDYADMSKRDQMKALAELSRGVTRKKRESKPSQASTPEELRASAMRRDLSLLDAGSSDVVYLSELEDLLKFNWEASNLKQQDVVVIFGSNEGNTSTGTNKSNAGQALAAFRLKEAGFTVIGIPTRSGGRSGQKLGYLKDQMLEADPRWRALMSEQIAKIKQAKDAGKVVIFPRKGVGTGYAGLRENAPKIAKKLDEALVKLGIDNATGMSDDDFRKFSEEFSDKPTAETAPVKSTVPAPDIQPMETDLKLLNNAMGPASAPDIQKGMRGEDWFYYHYTEAGNGDLIAKGSIKPDADGRIYFFDTLESVNEKIFEEISTMRALEGKPTSGGHDIVAIPRSDFDVYEPKPDMAAPDSSAMYIEPKAEIRISNPHVMYSGQNEFVKPTRPPEIPQKISETAAPEIKTTADAMNAGLRTSTTRAMPYKVGQYLDFSKDGVKGFWRVKEIKKYDFSNPADVAAWESTELWNYDRIKQQGGPLLKQLQNPNARTFILERVDTLPQGVTAEKAPMYYSYGPDKTTFDPSFLKLNAASASAPVKSTVPAPSVAPRGVVDAVVAVAKLDKNGKVEGGTGWATEGALLRGIPTYVYDEMTNRWYTASSPQKSFQGWTPVDAPPTNVRSIAGIGTRKLSERGYQEIVAYVESLDKSVVIHSGGAGGSDAAFEETHSKRGGEVVSHSFDGHRRVSKSNGLLVHSRDEMVSTRDEVNAIGKSLGKSITWDKADRRTGDSTEELVMRNMFQIAPGRVVPAQSAQVATNRAPVAPPSGNARLNAGAVPNNIYSAAGKNVSGMSPFERGLRSALTNPTNDIVPYVDPKTGYKGAQDSFSLGSIKKKYPVVFQGKIFPSAEHAFFYMSNELRLPKSTDTEAVYEDKLNQMQEKMMSEVITEKLRQHPELIAGIDKIAAEQGITGEEWIAKQSHYTGKADNRRASHWTGDGLNSGFIRALSLAYSSAKKQPESVPFKPEGTGPVTESDKIVNKMMIEWSQDRNNWRFFQPIDRYKSFRSKQIYYVSGNIQDAAESSAAILARAGMAKTEDQKIMLEKQAKEVLASEGIETSIVKSWERMVELSIGQVKDGQNKVRLRRTIGSAAPFGMYYDSPIKNKLAQLDEKVKGGSIQEIISDIAAKNGVDLSENGARVATSANLETDLFPNFTDLEKTMRKFVMSMRALIKAKTKIEAAKIPEGSRFRRATLSDTDAKKLAVVIAKISAIFKEYSDPSLQVESRLMNRFGSESGRGSLSAGAQLASELVKRGEKLTEERIREISKMTRNRVEAIARASGIDLGNISEGGKVFNRPLHQEVGHSTPEQRFIDSLSDGDGVSGKRFQASVEESYGFRGAPGQDKKKIAKVGKAIATTMRYFPALAERVVPTPSGFTRSARGVGKPIFSLPGGYSKEFTPEGVESIRQAIGRESLATEAFAEGNFKDRVVMIRLGNLLKSNLLVPNTNFNTFDSLVKTYLTKEFDLERRRAAKVEKLVGPLAKITEIDQNKIDPLAISEKYREDPTAIGAESLIRRLNSIEIAIDYGTAQKMGVLDARGRSAPNLYAQLSVGIISPQTYVSSKVRVLPGGAVISTDPAYIEAYGYPKVLPYVVVPNVGWRTSKDSKEQFILREIVVPDRGVESPSSPIVPIKSGGDKAMEVNYRRDALLSATRANMAFEDRAALKENGLAKSRVNTPDLDRKARLDFIIDQVDLLAETPSSWTSKEMFDTTMAALRENMTPSDFTALTSGGGEGAGDITGASKSSRWALSKNFQQLIMKWQTAEPDYTFKEASERWRLITTAKPDFTATGGSDSLYEPPRLVAVRSGDTTRYVSPTSDEAVKAYLDGKVLNEVSTDENFARRSKPVLVRRSTDVDAAYPVIFAGERSRAIDDLLIATDDMAKVAYQLSYALGYGTDMLPGNYRSDATGAMTDLVRTVDVKPGEKIDLGADTIAAAARTMATLIDSELIPFSTRFQARIDLTSSSGRPILPNFREDANVQLALLKALDTQNKYKENRRLLSEIQALDSDAAMTGALPDEIAAAKSSLQQRFDRNVVFNVGEITRAGAVVTLRPGAKFKDQPNDPGVTVKPGMGVTGDPLEELSTRFAEIMLGNEDPSALRTVLGKSKVLDLFNEQPADVVAEIVKRAWQIHGENATPDLAKHITFNYDGREYYGTMGVGPDGRPVFVGQPENTNERFLPSDNPLQSEPSVRQDTSARKALIADAEKNAQDGTGTDQRDYLRSEDRARTVVVRKNSQWRVISPVVAAKFAQMDAAKLDAFIRLIVQDLLKEYVGPDGKPVSYDDVIAKLDFADLVKNGPFTIAHRLFDHGIKGNFKDIEEFIRYTQEARDPVGTVELGGNQARDIGIDPETGRLIIGGQDDPLDAVDTKTKSEINTEERASLVAPETINLDEQRGYHPEVGSTEHDTMMAYEQSKMLSGIGMPWTKALSDIGRPLREAPGSMKAFHGRGGFGAGFAADAAYMAWKGYLDPTALAVSAGFNSINFLPMKYAPKVGLIGAAANLGLTAVTGGDMGRAAMMTIGGLLGGAVGAFGGGFGAIGGSFAGSEVADYIWSDVFGNKNKSRQQLMPNFDPINAPKPIKISPHFGP